MPKYERNPYSSIFIEGNLGSGKTLCGVSRAMNNYVTKRKRFGTNVDIFIEKFPKKMRSEKHDIVRLPDYPTVNDLKLIGLGYEGELCPGREGLLLFDECASWLNSREWNAKTRQAFIEFLTHARKMRWDLAFLIQDIDCIDKQIRTMLMKYKVHCYNSYDFGIFRALPEFHIAVVRRVTAKSDILDTRWYYRSRDVYDIYDTEQVFSPYYDKGPYTPITEYYYSHKPKRKDNIQLIMKYACLAIMYIDSLLTATPILDVMKKYKMKKNPDKKIHLSGRYIDIS